MKYTVVLTAAYPPIARAILAGEFDVIEHPTEPERSEDDVIAILSEADAAITLLSDPLTRRVLSSNPNLRMVANYAVGTNNIDVEAARELGIIVTNTPGVLTEATADLTIALILTVTRRLIEGDAEVRRTLRCEWEPLHLLGTGLQDKRLGIIGMGRIGSAVARRAPDQHRPRADRRRSGALRRDRERPSARRGARRLRGRAARQRAAGVDAERGRAAAHRLGHRGNAQRHGPHRGHRNRAVSSR